MAEFEEQEIFRWKEGEVEQISDRVVVESSLELVVNNRSVVTLLCSPDQQKSLAVGYLWSEGLIDSLDVLQSLDHMSGDKRVDVRIETDQIDLEAYFSRKRALTSSCGRASAVIERLEDLNVEKSKSMTMPEMSDLTELMGELQKGAELFRKTGGSHTAALAGEGEVKYLAEDIGRHNAVDKVIGQAVRDGYALGELVLLTSGRLSSEMVLKAIRSSVPIVVSRSAPTTLAVRMGRITGLGMVGFVRGNRLSIYSGEGMFKEISAG